MNRCHGFGFALPTALPFFAGGLLSACWIEVESPPRTENGSIQASQGGVIDRGGSVIPRPGPPAEYSTLPGIEDVEPPSEPTLPPDLYRDLIVIDPTIVGGPLADDTDPEAPLSFRAQMQWLAGPAREPFDFARSWLERWATQSSVGAPQAPVTPRSLLQPMLLEPWFGAPTADALPDGSAVTYATTPRWQDTPFRLIAIVNRVDLAEEPCSGAAGELRYVYSAVDVEQRAPLAATVILEIPYPATRGASGWARAWSDIAQLSEEEYPEALAELAREVQREADPLRVRVRSNEAAFGGPGAQSWEMREFQLHIVEAELELVQVPLEFTPRADADPALLAEHVLAHADELGGAGASLPEPLRAGAAEIAAADFSWPVLGVSERLRQAFSVQTCNGCHGGDARALPFQHIAPGAAYDAWARLSPFLYDPGAKSDELGRRARALAALLAAQCPADNGDDSLYPGL